MNIFFLYRYLQLFLKGLPHLSLSMSRPSPSSPGKKTTSSRSRSTGRPPNFYDQSMYCPLPEYTNTSKTDLCAESMSAAIDRMNESSGKNLFSSISIDMGSNMNHSSSSSLSSRFSTANRSTDTIGSLENIRISSLHESAGLPQDIPRLSHSDPIARQKSLLSSLDSISPLSARQSYLRDLLSLAQTRPQSTLFSPGYGGPDSLLLNNNQSQFMHPLLGDLQLQQSLAIGNHINHLNTQAAIIQQRRRDAVALDNLTESLTAIQHENEVLRTWLLEKLSKQNKKY